MSIEVPKFNMRNQCVELSEKSYSKISDLVAVT